jgi:hypothetical protein
MRGLPCTHLCAHNDNHLQMYSCTSTLCELMPHGMAPLRSIVKSYTKDLSLPIFELVIQHSLASLFVDCQYHCNVMILGSGFFFHFYILICLVCYIYKYITYFFQHTFHFKKCCHLSNKIFSSFQPLELET